MIETQPGQIQQVLLRPVQQTDSERISAIYLASRRSYLTYAPLAHTEAEILHWVSTTLVLDPQTFVAEINSKVVGFIVLSSENGSGWIDPLYLHPTYVGLGIGSHLLSLAKETLDRPIRLYCFQENSPALRFYQRHGFNPIGYSNGENNEEKCPDVLLEWRPNSL